MFRLKTAITFAFTWQCMRSPELAATQTPSKIAKFNVNELNEGAIQSSLNYVKPKYVDLGGDDQVSKGPSLLAAMSDDASSF